MNTTTGNATTTTTTTAATTGFNGGIQQKTESTLLTSTSAVTSNGHDNNYNQNNNSPQQQQSQEQSQQPTSSVASTTVAATATVKIEQPPAAPTAIILSSQQQQQQSSSNLQQQQQQQQQQHVRVAVDTKRPLMTHTKDGKLLSEKKLRRLEKNRLSARECRRRKREAAENMMHEINELEAENLKLRLQLQIGQEAETNIALEQSKVTAEIQSLLQSGASEADIYTTLEEFKEKYADYGKSRRSSIEFHLRQIERLLKPTQATTVVMHAIGNVNNNNNNNNNNNSTNDNKSTPTAAVTTTAVAQPPQPATNNNVSSPLIVSNSAAVASADTTKSTISPISTEVIPCCDGSSVQSHDSATTSSTTILPPPETVIGTSQFDAKKNLFQYLVNYLHVTPEQAAALKDSRLVSQELDTCLETAMNVLYELKQRLAQTGEDLETEFSNVRSILSPTQAAKFLIWVANNDACIHMLNELWDRVYPQPYSNITTTNNNNNQDIIMNQSSSSQKPPPTETTTTTTTMSESPS